VGSGELRIIPFQLMKAINNFFLLPLLTPVATKKETSTDSSTPLAGLLGITRKGAVAPQVGKPELCDCHPQRTGSPAYVRRAKSRRCSPVPYLPEYLYGRIKCVRFWKTEREGFEPSLKLPPNSISSAAPSTTRPPLQALRSTSILCNRINCN
jgi:hypothetical protein